MTTDPGSGHTKKRIFIVGGTADFTLEESYRRAFERLGHRVETFDLRAALMRHVRFGKVGQKVSRYVPVGAWQQKANRELLVAAAAAKPDVMLIVGMQQVLAGALAQFKTIVPTASLVLLWPDTMLNLMDSLIGCITLCDAVATYSERSVEMFRRLCPGKVFWLPLAGDPALHGTDATDEALARGRIHDVTFIGGWRPEREAALLPLTTLGLKIWGPAWDKRCKAPALVKAWQGKPLLGKAFADVIRASRISLNVIDETNYPAANMRFFEIPMAGGLQVSSACPEQSSVFLDGKHLFYYDEPAALPDLVRTLLADPDRRERVAAAGRALVRDEHTYSHRAEALLSGIG